ncbi:response regulator [Candidatus Sulfurimonas marisnigri]|uniref:Response regulator n=1 Tax=Candidatus Sulfurimonas marisnigri TaxID=2740405 RepID=A0A7S7M157_9BACT|nr:response regulator [Candidatus Sulfurimonas marisnigri]QOY55025.1 response regulator [Candidatus Sulfurimonas marisnigri]
MINIAVIDDEIEILSMIDKYLSRDKNNSVKTYNNPLNALSSISNSTDVVLLDIMMPQMNGLELLPKLKEKCPDVKVIMMTAYSTLDKVLEAHRQGAEHYLMKPFSSLDAISKKIDEVLAK